MRIAIVGAGGVGGGYGAALAKAGADTELLAQINATGCDTEILTPAQTVERIKTDYVKWGGVVKDANIRTE